VDSCFPILEAIATVIYDQVYITYKNVKQWHIQLCVCLLGILCSLPFCTNVGHNLSDVIDHYLSNYIMILLGV